MASPPPPPHPTHFFAIINYSDTYIQPLILHALKTHFPPSSYTLISSLSSLPSPTSPLLQITSYETLDFTHLLAHPTTSFANSYVIRKALIRKHHLAFTVSAWAAKFPESLLQRHVVKPTLHLELDYAEFLDEALLEAYELRESWARNAKRISAAAVGNGRGGEGDEEGVEWWILKPSMSDRGQGIRVFCSEEELRAIFEEWEGGSDDEEEDEDEDEDGEDPRCDPSPVAILHDQDHSKERSTKDDDNSAISNHPTGGIITSQLRHFIVQPYIHPPLLFPAFGNRKFHIRSYVLAVGALKVYLYEEMLALFAPSPYTPPSTSTSTSASSFDPSVHLTNTCLQNLPSQTSATITTNFNPKTTPVTHLSSLPSTLPSPSSTPPFSPHSLTPSTPPSQTNEWKSPTLNAIALCTSELFLAAARTQSTHFQPLPNCFEIFGLDWLVDGSGHVWLLEVNAFPDFAQSGEGEGEKGVVRGFWEGVLGVVGEVWGLGVGGGGGSGEGEGEEKGEEKEGGEEGGDGDGNESKKEEKEEENEKKGGRWRWGMRKVLDVDLGRR